MRLERFLCDYGCLMSGLVSVPIAVTMEISSIEFIINSTNAKCIICPSDISSKISQLNCPSLQYLIEINDNSKSVTTIQKPYQQTQCVTNNKITVTTLQNLIQDNKDKDPCYHHMKEDEIITLVYTSGSTGLPKGSILTEDTWNQSIQLHFMPQDPMVMIVWSIMDRKDATVTLTNGGRVAIYNGVCY